MSAYGYVLAASLGLRWPRGTPDPRGWAMTRWMPDIAQQSQVPPLRSENRDRGGSDA